MTTDKKEIPPQQAMPQVYPQYVALAEDEINLLDLWAVLVKRWRLIFSVSVLSMVIAIVVALSIPSVYESKTILLPPTEKQIEFFGVTSNKGVINDQSFFKKLVSVDKVFGAFKEQLYTAQRQVFDEMKLVGKLSDNVNVDDVFNSFQSVFKLEQIKNDMVSGITLSRKSSDPELDAEIINRLVQIASDNVRNNLFENISEKVNAQILGLSEEIRQLRDNYVANNLDKIDRLRVQNKIKEESIRNQIEALRHKAVNDRKDRIKILSEHAVIAHDYGIMLGTGTKLLGVNIERQSPLYLRGEKVLLTEIELLKNRQSDDPFIPGLRELGRQLVLLKLKLKTKIAGFTVKDKSDIFIDGLQEREIQLQSLQGFELTRFQLGSVMRVHQEAFPSKVRIKPKRKLIVALGGVLGLMLGVFAAFFFNFVENNRKEEGAEG